MQMHTRSSRFSLSAVKTMSSLAVCWCSLLIAASQEGVVVNAQQIAPAGATNPEAEKDITELWSLAGVSMPVSDRVDANVYGVYVGGGDVKAVLVETPTKMSRHLTLTPGYAFIAAPPIAGRKYREHQLRFDATLRLPFNRFTIDDRNLFELRFRRGLNEVTRYRNRLRINYPLKIRNVPLRLFAYDEAFYDWGARGWTRNRAAFGVGKTFAQRFTGEASYIRQNDRGRRDTNAIFISLLVRLKWSDLFPK